MFSLHRRYSHCTGGIHTAPGVHTTPEVFILYQRCSHYTRGVHTTPEVFILHQRCSHYTRGVWTGWKQRVCDSSPDKVESVEQLLLKCMPGNRLWEPTFPAIHSVPCTKQYLLAQNSTQQSICFVVQETCAT